MVNFSLHPDLICLLYTLNTISVQIKDFRKNLLLLSTLHIHKPSAKCVNVQFTPSQLNEMAFYICFAWLQHVSWGSWWSSSPAHLLCSNKQAEQVAATSFTLFSPGKHAGLSVLSEVEGQFTLPAAETKDSRRKQCILDTKEELWPDLASLSYTKSCSSWLHGSRITILNPWGSRGLIWDFLITPSH